MDIISRIKSFMEARGLTSSQLADTCDIPRPTMSQILNGRSKKISNDLIARLHTHFPYLSIMWLMFGEGDMFKNGNIEISEPENTAFLSRQQRQHTDNQIDFSETPFSENIPSEQSEKSVQYNQRTFTNDYVSANSISGDIDTFGRQTFNPTNNSHSATTEMADFLGAFTSGIFSKNGDSPSAQHGKTVSAIMVFYTDNSYEMFTPSAK